MVEATPRADCIYGFASKRPWQKEIKKMLQNGFKMEVEAMISKDLSYLTEEYVPMKIKDKKQWLD